MRSIGPALTWEFWWQQRWPFLGIFSLTVFFVLWTHLTSSGISGRTWNSVPDAESVAKGYVLALCLLLYICCSMQMTGLVGRHGRPVFSTQVYALPVRTSVLAAYQIILLSVFMSLLVLSMAGFFYLVAGFRFPVLVPAMCCSAVLALTMAGFWMLRGSQVLCLLFFAVGPLMMTVWLAGQFFFMNPYLSGMGVFGKTPLRFLLPEMWPFGKMPLPLLVLLVGVSLLAAYFVALVGMARDRRGDTFSLAPVREWLFGRMETRAVRQKRFSSPAAAQFWFEWRQKGHLMPVLAAVVHVCLFLLTFFGVIPLVDEAFTGSLILSCIALSYAWFPAGFLFGHRGISSGKWELGAFAATRPLRDRDLSFATLKAGAASIVATFAVCILAVLPWVAWFLATGRPGPLHTLAGLVGKAASHPYLYFWCLCGMLLLAWTSMVLGACMTLTGRKFVMAIFLVCPFEVLAAKMQDFLPVWGKTLFEGFWSVIGLGVLLGILAAFTAAYRKRLIGKGLVLLAIGIWLILSACALGMGGHFRVPGIASSLLPGFLALPAAPLALAPLALSWNRHR
jgi:hypothetical protein